MRLCIKVKPGSKQERVEKRGENSFTVAVRPRPIEGKANAAVVELLSRELGIAKSRIAVVRGHRGRDKIIEVLE